jgi:diguanylate cyclase (GGDEF)-like protein
VKLFPRPRRAGARPRRVPLMLSFGVLSLTLTLVLGIVLAAQVRDAVTERDLSVLTKTTKGVIAVTIQTIVSQVAYGNKGIPDTNGQQRAQANAISAAARVLVANSDVVSVEAVLANGLVIGGANSPPVATKLSRDTDFRAALSGVIRVRTLGAHDASATPVEQRLLRRYGDLLLTQQGVRLTPGGPILAVVRSYAPLGPTRAEAASEAWSINRVLALGLLVFWLALFRLVLGASRALTRHSKANAYLATHDALTDLPNRALLRDRTERAVVATRRSGLHVALILMDLNRFKEVNDTLGHPYGDMLLKQIGPRLREQLRDSDTVSRLGGDEFVVMLPDLRSSEMAFAVAEKLAAAMREPFALDGVLVDVDSSAGLVTTPEHGDDFDELLQHADVAMYLAKQDSIAVVAYAPELDSYSPARLSLLADLRQAVEQPELQAQIVLYYQPQADLVDGQITGVEALVRWQHPKLGLISPDDFIPLAEHTGIIRPLTWRILRSALEQNREWAKAGMALRVSVNISARCLLDANFSDKVGDMLTETGVPAERLELELTESVIMSDPDRALGILKDLAARGIRLSIDDFGTGYSSMAYLKQLPVHEIKIDRSFVTNMDTDMTDDAIVRSSLELARNLDLTVVAEGVETPEVWRRLSDLGCETAQGYLLTRPLPAVDFTAWMAERAVAVGPATGVSIGRTG